MKTKPSTTTSDSSTISSSPSPAPPSSLPATTNTPAANGASAVPAPSPKEAPARTKQWKAEFDAATQKACEGHAPALAKLRKLLGSTDWLTVFPGLSGRVRSSVTERTFSKNDLIGRELANQEVTRLRAHLFGLAPTVIERMLVERILTGWLDLHASERLIALSKTDHQTDFWQRRAHYAHQRFMAALKLLTAIRRTPRPALQVNIGEQQVNVGG